MQVPTLLPTLPFPAREPPPPESLVQTRERLRERKSSHKVLNDERTGAEKKAQKKENDNLIRGHKVEVRVLVPHRNIAVSTMSLLMEGARLADEGM